MHLFKRRTLGALGGVCLLLMASGCGDGGGVEASVDATSPATTTASPPEVAPLSPPTGTPTPEASADSETLAAPPFGGTVVDVQFAGGEVRTAEPRVVVPLGGQVRLVVTSDVVDEVHVHGVDEYISVSPGASVTYDFTASIPGIFEVEMHEAGDLLFTLQVEP